MRSARFIVRSMDSCAARRTRPFTLHYQAKLLSRSPQIAQVAQARRYAALVAGRIIIVLWSLKRSLCQSRSDGSRILQQDFRNNHGNVLAGLG